MLKLIWAKLKCILQSDSCNMGINCPDFKLTDFLCFDHMDIVDKNGTMSRYVIVHPKRLPGLVVSCHPETFFVLRYCGENGPKDAFLSEEVAIAFRSSAWFPNIGFRCRIVCRESGSAYLKDNYCIVNLSTIIAHAILVFLFSRGTIPFSKRGRKAITLS